LTERILIGVAWPYANGPLHLGHVAGAYLPADIFARYHRLKGNEVLMVSGSDQHGAPITIRAEQESITPQEIATKYHKIRCFRLIVLSAGVFFLTAIWKARAFTVAFLKRVVMNVTSVVSL